MSETSLIEQEKLYWRRQAADFEKELTQAEARIHELEAQVGDLSCVRGAQEEGLLLRIAKAKKLLEITQAALVETDAPVIKFGIKDALAALEGK